MFPRLFGLTVLGVLLWSGALASEAIRLTTVEWLPYMSKNDVGVFTPDEIEDGSGAYGILSRLVAAAFALEGVTVEYGNYPLGRAYMLAQKGEFDGSVGWNSSPERADAFYYSAPLMRKSRVFFHLKAFDFDWNTLDDLKGLRIGGGIATHYGDAFSLAEQEGWIHVERVAGRYLNFKKLLAGRINIFPIAVESGYEFLNEYFTPKEVQSFTYHPKVFQDTTYHLILTRELKRNIRMMALFNRGLSKLRETGKYDSFFVKPPSP